MRRKQACTLIGGRRLVDVIHGMVPELDAVQLCAVCHLLTSRNIAQIARTRSWPPFANRVSHDFRINHGDETWEYIREGLIRLQKNGPIITQFEIAMPQGKVCMGHLEFRINARRNKCFLECDLVLLFSWEGPPDRSELVECLHLILYQISSPPGPGSFWINKRKFGNLLPLFTLDYYPRKADIEFSKNLVGFIQNYEDFKDFEPFEWKALPHLFAFVEGGGNIHANGSWVDKHLHYLIPRSKKSNGSFKPEYRDYARRWFDFYSRFTLRSVNQEPSWQLLQRKDSKISMNKLLRDSFRRSYVLGEPCQQIASNWAVLNPPALLLYVIFIVHGQEISESRLQEIVSAHQWKRFHAGLQKIISELEKANIATITRSGEIFSCRFTFGPAFEPKIDSRCLKAIVGRNTGLIGEGEIRKTAASFAKELAIDPGDLSNAMNKGVLSQKHQRTVRVFFADALFDERDVVRQ